MLTDQQILSASLFTPSWFLTEHSGAAAVNNAYFERRLPADVHKEHIVPFQHVLKHLLARKRSDGWSGRGRKPTHVAWVLFYFSGRTAKADV